MSKAFTFGKYRHGISGERLISKHVELYEPILKQCPHLFSK